MRTPNSADSVSGLPLTAAAANTRFAPTTADDGMPNIPVVAYFESPLPHETIASAAASIDKRGFMRRIFGPTWAEGNRACATVRRTSKEDV